MNKIPWKDMLEVGLAIFGLILAVVLIAATSGCSSVKSRSIETQGMFVSDSGQLAIGRATVDAVPEGVDSAVIHYAEDTAWLSPSTKTHKIDIVLTGESSTVNAKEITKGICNAFVAVKGCGGGDAPAENSTDGCDDCTPVAGGGDAPAERCAEAPDLPAATLKAD